MLRENSSSLSNESSKENVFTFLFLIFQGVGTDERVEI